MKADLQRRFERLENTRRDVLARVEGHEPARLNRLRADRGMVVPPNSS